MKRITRGFALCALFLCTFSFSAFAANPIGKVVAVAGAPSVSGPGGNRTLSAGAVVFEDDKISVGSAGNAQIMLNDGTKLVVGPSSSLLLDKYVSQGPAGVAESVGIKALRGTFRFITGKSKKSAYHIATSNATIGIRGTGFDFWSKDKTGVLVMIGSVNLNNNHGKSVLVRADCEMGRSSPSEARRLTGQLFGEAVRTNLPYVLNQKPLSPAFRLPIENCRTLLTNASAPNADDNDNGQDGRKHQNNNPSDGGNTDGGDCTGDNCR
jgi:hypothetical protein